MLVSFSVQNYLSFHEKMELNLLADACDKTVAPTSLRTVEVGAKKKPVQLLKSVLLYGPNASGKSNLLLALHHAVRFIRTNNQRHEDEGTSFKEPFCLHATSRNEPSEFEFIFIIGGNVYRYGFCADKDQIIEEWLFLTNVREIKIFTRTWNSDQKAFDIVYGASGKEFKKINCNKNQLVLTVASAGTIQVAKTLLNFLSTIRKSTRSSIRVSDQDIDVISKFLYFADTGIVDIKSRDITFEEFHAEKLQPLPDETRNFVAEEIKKNWKDIQEFSFLYRDNTGQLIPILEGMQSSGTIQFLRLIHQMLLTMRNGGVLLCDELDRGLHPVLAEMLLRFMSHPQQRAQFICTSHNVDLLRSWLVRRDQIYLTEKGADGATRLSSIADFTNVRNDARLDKQYMEGRFGAIPLLNETAFDDLLNGLLAAPAPARQVEPEDLLEER